MRKELPLRLAFTNVEKLDYNFSFDELNWRDIKDYNSLFEKKMSRVEGYDNILISFFIITNYTYLGKIKDGYIIKEIMVYLK